MTAQRIATNAVVRDSDAAVHKAVKEMLLEHYRSTKSTVRRPVWVCEICGMVHLAQVPDCCDCCGVANALVQQQDTRQEIGNHW